MNFPVSTPLRGLTLSVTGWMALLLLRLFGPRHDPWSGAPRGQHIRYCRKPDFAVMYADGQCAHYKTNSCKGLQVLRPDLPYTYFLSLFFPERERGSRKRGDNRGSLRRPRGPPDDPVESGNSLNRIYWSVSRVLRGLGLLSFPLRASHPLFSSGSAMNTNIWFRRAKNTAPTCIHTYLHTRIHTFDSFDRHNPFVVCMCAKDNPLYWFNEN